MKTVCCLFASTMMFLFLGLPAQAMRHVCGTDSVEMLEYDWCIDYDERGRNPDVLYYLHGVGRTPSDWQSNSENIAIQKEWQKRQVAPPTVISVSFGRAWLFSDLAGFFRPAYYPSFVNVIMRTMEAKIGGVRGRRLLKGESMGGFNASQLYLKSGQYFDRVALVCPAIPTIGPFASSEESDAFVARNLGFVDWKLIFGFKFWTFQAFPSQEIWAMHNPLVLAKRLNRHSPPLYVSAGLRDEFGFFEGAAKLVKIARARGVKVTWVPLPVGHCANDPKTLAEFLAPLKK